MRIAFRLANYSNRNICNIRNLRERNSHNSLIHSPSSGERKGNSLNPIACISLCLMQISEFHKRKKFYCIERSEMHVVGCCKVIAFGAIQREKLKPRQQNPDGNREPKRVIVPYRENGFMLFAVILKYGEERKPCRNPGGLASQD